VHSRQKAQFGKLKLSVLKTGPNPNDISDSMSTMTHSKMHQPSSGPAEKNKDNPNSPSKTKSKNVEPKTPPFIGIRTTPALAAVFGAFLYYIRATNLAVFGVDLGLLWGVVPVECLVWSFGILVLACIDIWEFIKC